MIYPGYTAMTTADARAAEQMNQKNGWGITYADLLRLGRRHETARAAGDVRTMEKIEYRLTDINFHTECGQLHRGEYEKFYDGCEETPLF